MDYLREVLERQERLLRRLLTGERDTERGEKSEGLSVERVRTPAEGDGETLPSGGGSPWGHTAAATAAADTERPAERRRDPAGGGEPLTEADVSIVETLNTQAAEFRRYRRSDALWRDAAPAAWPESVLTAEAAVDMERISRAVQRDARRYDGGFTMY